MTATLPPRVVLLTRKSEYDLLLLRHGTREQARFFLETRDQSIDVAAERHARLEAALSTAAAAIPPAWRRTRLDREDLDRFLFDPEDLVVAIGQDGLVANVAKYLDGQSVIGINPDVSAFEGVLVLHAAEATADLLAEAAAGRGRREERTMVEAEFDDGQLIVALNELFIGHRTHQSARYRIGTCGREERQSSSGVIVATGTGATGWARSIHRNRRGAPPLPAPTDRRLAFLVREAWPSVATATDLTDGLLDEEGELSLTSEMGESGVVFGDGIESDSAEFGWGRRLSVRVARRRLVLMT